MTCFGFRRNTKRMIAARIRLSRVENAAPATPQPKPKMKMAFPMMFITFEITETLIGKRLFPPAR